MKLALVLGGLLVAVAVGASSLVLVAAPAPSLLSFLPTPAAKAEIPEPMLSLYQEAASTCPGLPWPVLAAVGRNETDHGRSAWESSAGARGPMQFLPGTWETYGVDADGDGVRNLESPSDAVYGAARLLCANGGGEPATLRDALWRYNNASWYVEAVLADAVRYGEVDGSPATAAPGELLSSPRLVLTDRARDDLASGVVDPRVVVLIGAMTATHTIGVSVFKTGHSTLVEGTERVSNHFVGRAVDIYLVDGEAVSTSSPATAALVQWLRSLEGTVRPSEVGQPFVSVVGPGFFSDAAHQDHIHVGFDGDV